MTAPSTSSRKPQPVAAVVSGSIPQSPTDLVLPAHPGVDVFDAEVPISLVLTGTVVGKNAREGTASLGTSVENTQVYEANARLPNGARLLEIHADHVVLQRHDIKATLYVSGKEPGGSEHAPQQTQEQRALVTIEGQGNDASIAAPSLPSLTNVVRSRPVYEGDDFIGMRIDPGSDSSSFAELGLLPGDVVVAIADEPLDQLSSVLEAVMERSALTAVVELSLRRRGYLQNLSVDLRLLSGRTERVMNR